MISQRYRTSLDDYAAYHRNPRNKLTHYVGIPLIVLSLIALLRRVELDVALGPVVLNAALILLVAVLIFYLALNLFSGFAMALVFAVMYAAAPHIGVPLAWALFVGGWILQFIGHHFEGKSPAFFRNAVHLLIGPVWILNDLLLKLRLPAYDPQKA